MRVAARPASCWPGDWGRQPQPRPHGVARGEEDVARARILALNVARHQTGHGQPFGQRSKAHISEVLGG